MSIGRTERPNLDLSADPNEGISEVEAAAASVVDMEAVQEEVLLAVNFMSPTFVALSPLSY